jgi:hypothetical protein
VGGLIGMLAMSTKQDAEKISQRRSRFDQRLNVPKRSLASLLTAALLTAFLSILQDTRSCIQYATRRVVEVQNLLSAPI